MTKDTIMICALIIASLLSGFFAASITKHTEKKGCFSIIISILFASAIIIMLANSLLEFRIKATILRLVMSIACFVVIFKLRSNAINKKNISGFSKNPILLEAMDICKEKNIVAVQVMSDALYFFDSIHNTNDCKGWSIFSEVKDEDEYNQKIAQFQNDPTAKPFHDTYRTHTIRFADKNYPAMDDATRLLFAETLAAKLPGFTHACHSVSYYYCIVSGGETGSTFHYNPTTQTGYASSTPTKKEWHGGRNIYLDYVVYSKKALQALEDAKGKEAEQQKQANADSKTNSWY